MTGFQPNFREWYAGLLLYSNCDMYIAISELCLNFTALTAKSKDDDWWWRWLPAAWIRYPKIIIHNWVRAVTVTIHTAPFGLGIVLCLPSHPDICTLCNQCNSPWSPLEQSNLNPVWHWQEIKAMVRWKWGQGYVTIRYVDYRSCLI